jgi:predicted enzyme related to lactoylglutathione lyase
MGQPVVHFEIIGKDPAALRGFYGELFGWEFDTSAQVSPAVSEPSDYGFVERIAMEDGTGIPGGIGGGAAYDPMLIFYVFVPDVGAALHEAERLGGTRRMGPDRASARDLVVAHVADPAGNVVGLAGPK